MNVTLERDAADVGAVVVARVARNDLGPDEKFDLDLLQAVPLEAALRDLISTSGTRVVLDLARVAYMDSKTFWAMVRAAKTLQASGGRFAVANLNSSVARLLRLTGSDRFLSAYPSVEEARAALLTPE